MAYVQLLYWYVLNRTNAYIRVRMRTYAAMIRVQTILLEFKRCKQVFNPKCSACFSQNVLQESLLPQQWQKCWMLLGQATFGSLTTNRDTAESLGYILLVRPILGVLSARTVKCSGQCYVWLMGDVRCASRVQINRTWFLNFGDQASSCSWMQ